MIALKERKVEDSAGTEGARRATGVPVEQKSYPDPEVRVFTKRKRVTLSYKVKVINTVAELRSQGEGAIGAYLRKEGLYYASVHKWAQLHEKGLLTSKKPGPHQKTHKELQAEIAHLKRELEQSEKKLKKAGLVIELQKKLSSILELDLHENSEKSDEN